MKIDSHFKIRKIKNPRKLTNFNSVGNQKNNYFWIFSNYEKRSMRNVPANRKEL